ncbi:hypothetical protein MNBD_ALPHA12-1208 [hydrothermal vent metagenome]|uniref:Hydrolase of the HAD superfamily n=1 Tax=hydrothermal vent metagenome TaxID=652676 RepID=A0A3B0UAZ8_9ZZZZ
MARAVLFDVDGVLIHSMFHPDPSRCRRWDLHLKEDMGISPEDFQAFFPQRNAPVMRGEISLVEQLADFLPTIGYTGSPLDFIAYWLNTDTQLNHQLIQAIKLLARNADVELYLATNQEHLRAFHLWDRLGFSHIFKDMFYAARLGHAKPDNAYFDAVDRLLGPQDQPPLFFDDTKKVVEAAIAHGWDACLFDVTADFTSHPWVMDRIADKISFPRNS